MAKRRRQIRTKLIVTFILLVTTIVVASAAVWYRVTTGYLRREMENRILTIAEAGGLEFDPTLTIALVNGIGSRTRDIAQEQLRELKDRFEVREAYLFDRRQLILATTDTVGMDIGAVAPGLENYTEEISRALVGEAVVTIPFRDAAGNVYQTAFAPVVGCQGGGQSDCEIMAVFAIDLSLDFLDVFNDFRSTTVMLILVSVLLTVLVGIVFARSLSGPIATLVSSAERMERGELAEPVNVDSNDEIGYLGTALENMRVGIVRRDRHLRTMLAGVAHEIRNPLGGIEIFAGLLRDEMDADDARRSHLDKIVREVQNLKTIINEFLIYARPRKPIIEPFELRQVLDDAAFLLAADLAEREVELDVEMASEGLAVSADVEQIKRALLNLMKNAIQASSTGGRVEVRAQKAGDRIRVLVKDHGAGIHPDHVKQIFDPFFTTKGSGAGLGLSIVRSIIEENDGEIWVESVPGEKTVFFVVLPAVGAVGGGFRPSDTAAVIGT